MPITREKAIGLVKRMTVLPAHNVTVFGAEPKDVKKELADSLQAFCRSDDHALRVVSAIMDTFQFMPVRAQIREMCDQIPVNALNEKPTWKCQLCEGGGFVTVWKLCTYKGGSLQIEKAEVLQGYDYEKAMAFAKILPDNQTILSAAVPCSCLRPTHKLLTGERS